jgi:hypothetical protein
MGIGYMKTISGFSLLVLMTGMLISCSRHKAISGSDSERARAYLQPLLHLGESTTNMISRFGPPVYQETTKTNLTLYFAFPDDNKAARAAGVGGFEAFFTSNQLTRWYPAYEN